MANTAPNPGSIPHALTEPPFSPPVFIGRDKELEDLHQRLFDTKGDQFLLMVNGQGGMGKTSLASRYYHQHQREYQHVAWVLSNKNIRAALLQLAPGLGLDFAGSQLPPEEQLKVVMQQLTRLPSPSLLVIDNANEVEDLREHFLALQRCSNLHLILTSRITSFSGANFFPVQGLAQQAAQDLFKRYYPAHRPEENDLLSDMIEAVGHNTLIIELLAKNLNQINCFQEQYTLQNLLDDLQDNILLLSKSQEVSTAYQAKGTGLRHQSPEFIVLAMYDLKELDALQQQMMGIFALLPNEEILYSDLQLMLPELEFQAALVYLTDHGWVDYDQEGRSFKVNQVVQDVVRAKRAQFLRQDANLLLNTIEEMLDSDNALSKQFITISRRLLRFAENCLQNIPHWDKRLLNLCWSIGDFYQKTGDLYAALERYELMSKMADEIVQSDFENAGLKHHQIVSNGKLGETHSSLGNLNKALEHYENALQISEEFYQTYPDNATLKNDLAVSYSKLGETHSSLGNLSKALEYFEERSRLGEELYRTYPDNVSLKNGLAISYSKLGSTHSSLGNLSKALEYFEDETKLFEEL
ncbi:MAG: tetratricopeptide repeat protein, partial [Bacteroidota bacterium]